MKSSCRTLNNKQGMGLSCPGGFTLFEVLVALAILALALAAITRSTMLATDSATELKLRQLAIWVAENRVAMHRAADSFPPLGVLTGIEEQGGVNFQWVETTQGTPNANIRQLEIKVSQEGSNHALAQHVVFLSPR